MPRPPRRRESSRRLLRYELESKRRNNNNDELHNGTTETPFLQSSRKAPLKVILEEDPKEGVCHRTLKHIWLKLKPLLPLIFLICYSLGGGWLFQTFENSEIKKDSERREASGRTARNASESGIRDFLSKHLPDNFELPNDTIPHLLDLLVGKGNQTCNQPTTAQPKEWQFWTSVFYAGTIYTTIGFGNPAPKTDAGKIFTIVYGMFGIPLVLYNLANLGKFFTFLLWKIYSLFKLYIASRLCYHSGGKKYMEERDLSKEIAEIPFLLPLLVTVGWMCGCAGVFSFWEEWDYFTSLYFFFQCLTTIGLGDIVPHDKSFMLWTFMLVLVGMALVGMCWNLVQVKLDYLVASTSQKIHRLFIAHGEDKEAMRGLSERSSIRSKIDRLLEDENNILRSFLSEDRRRELFEEWEYQAMHKSEKVQTDYAEIETGTQVEPTTGTVGTQTGQTTGSEWVLQSSAIPYREHARHKTQASDEVVGLMKDLGTLLKDCSEIAGQSGGRSSAGISESGDLSEPFRGSYL